MLKLQKSFDVTTLSRAPVENYAKLTGRADVKALLEGEAYPEFASDRQLIDLFVAYPEKFSPDQLTGFCGRFRAGSTRLLRASRRIRAKPIFWLGRFAGNRMAGCARASSSTFLGERREIGKTAPLYVKPNRHFRLPPDGHTPIIMIGAETGVAPYRAFVEERIATGSKGKSWLFFGERNFTNDFLYQLEWQDYLARGILRVSTLHSRVISRKRSTSSIASGKGVRRCKAGFRKARIFTFAATRRAWRRTSTRRS